MNTFTVYILISKKDNKRYIGCTGDLKRRLLEHHSGRVKSTRYRRPLELIYTEEFGTKKEAVARERYLKTGKGREYLRNIQM